MRTVTVALGSFIVGALSVLLLGSHTSTVLQPAWGQTAIKVEGAVPVVPPLRHIVARDATFTNIVHAVDGTEVENGTFKNVTFEYGGGAYRLVNATVVPPVNFRFTGAAANTFNFLAMFGMIGCPASAPKQTIPDPNAPIMRTASLKTPIRGNIISPFGQK
jgi:hypothetical protein